MKISIANLKLAAVDFTKEFMTFAHFFGIWDAKRIQKNKYDAGFRDFDIVELKNPEEKILEAYRKATIAAVNKLFVLNTKFHSKYGEYIVGQLENFDEYDEVLEQIRSFLYETETKKKRA